MKVHIVEEPEPRGTAGAVKNVEHMLDGTTFVFNGDVMSNDWPGEWGGRSCCEACYEKHLAGKMPTADHLYRHLLPGLGFLEGDGI